MSIQQAVVDREPAPPAPPHVELRGVSKRFGGVLALDDISLSIAPGSVHGLIGENGAGKSTLGKIVAGVYRADSGSMLLHGKEFKNTSTRSALRHGIKYVAQELAIVPTRSVIDNVLLGVEPSRGGIVRERAMRERFAEVADQLGFRLDPSRRAGSLSIADQQKLELMRAIACDARLIVMDEPTAALSPMEATQLQDVIRRLSAAGATVVFVSHFLREILAVCDEVTVLRDGRSILSTPTSETTADHLVRTMIGRELDASFPPKVMPAVDPPEVLRVSGLLPGRAGLGRPVDLSIRRGEIVGLAGLAGSGRTEVCRALFGLEGRSGDVVVDGRPVTVESPRDAIGAGIAMLPESRRDEGLVMRRPIRENVSLPHLRRLSRGGFVDRRRERDEVAEILDRVGVRLARNQGNVGNLSGGNQQKVMFAKWLLDAPRVLIADEPTRGVDVGAKRSIYDMLAQLADEGMAILLVSSEIEELLGMAHRILVMRTGEVAGEIQGPDFDKEAVMAVAFGTAESGRAVT